MKIVPTLNFGGNCREALQMYEKAFAARKNIDGRRLPTTMYARTYIE